MDRIVYLRELYEKSVIGLTKSREDWKGLLIGMARYYKYSFDNNVLIYTQRSDTCQLATMDIWNKIGRRVMGYMWELEEQYRPGIMARGLNRETCFYTYTNSM